MKLLILGPKRSGKDSFAEICKDILGISFVSSSEFANEKCVFPVLGPKYDYKTPQECFDDRGNGHRQEWFELINDYNSEDPARLTKEILAVNDVYVGMRSMYQFEGSKHLFDLIIWIDGEQRVGEESSKSMDIPKSVADIIIDNNGTKQEFYDRCLNMFKFMRPKVNTLTKVGYTGSYEVFLNTPEDLALSQADCGPLVPEVSSFEFTNKFEAYDVSDPKQYE